MMAAGTPNTCHRQSERLRVRTDAQPENFDARLHGPAKFVAGYLGGAIDTAPRQTPRLAVD
jgi:hypothetical protein